MHKTFTRVILISSLFVLSIFSYNHSSAQGCGNLNWTMSPAPINGAYVPGQVINVCIQFNSYSQTGSSWLHGIELDFPPGWDMSTITNITTPSSCSGSGSGNWDYYTSVTATGSGQTFGPGFYYDSNSGGPLDGNPGNNWGDFCTTSFGANFTFCFDITIDAACGGGGNPLDGNDITPSVNISGDGQSGSWGGAYSNCTEVATEDPDIDPISINCCDANSGVSPGTVTICEIGTYNLLDLLGAPVDAPGGWTYTGSGTWTDPNPGLGTFDPTVDPAGDYTYTVVGTAGCISSTTITMQFIDYGVIDNKTYCDPNAVPLSTLITNPTYLPVPPGGFWYFDYFGAHTLLPTGILDPNVNTAGLYTYEYYSGLCKTIFSIQITLTPAGAVGCAATVDVCTSDPCFSPFNALGCNPAGGGNWIVFNDAGGYLDYINDFDECVDIAALFASTGYSGNLVFKYALGVAPCSPSFTDVTVNVYEPVNTGTYTQASVCVNDPPFILESLLDGTPDSGLNWYDESGNSIPNLFDPSTIAPGTTINLEYSDGLAGTSCQSTTLLQLTILPAYAYAGEDNTITVCESDPPFLMIDYLLDNPGNGESPQIGGTWYDQINPTVSYGDYFVPGTSTPGIYHYNITSTCATDDSYLTINVIPTPLTGTSGTLDICDNETNVQLSGGLTPPFDAGGTWYLAGSPVGSTVNGNTVTNGAVYTYEVGTSPCELTSTVTINLLNAPNAGVLTTTPQIYCETDPSFTLSTLFTTPPSVLGAYWTNPSNNPVSTINPSLGSSISGLYTYTIPDAGCGTATVSINITIEDTPDAGTDASVTVCPNGTGTVDLLAALGNPTLPTGGSGSWTSVPSGGPTTGIFNPAISDPAGNYTYTVTTAGGACTDQATVTVQYQILANPGTNNTITVCENDPSFNMIDHLGPGAVSGTWSGGTLTPGVFVPGTDATGTFTNSVTSGFCPAVTATLTVNVTPLPNAGTDATTSFCSSMGNVDLTSNLGGTPAGGGTWTDASGNPVTNPYNISSLCGNTYTYTYTVGPVGCSSSSDLTFTVVCPPNAGGDGTINICSTASPFSLYTGISGAYDTGGTWTNSSGTDVTATAGNINPATLGTGDTFTYTVSAPPCAPSTADVVVTVTPAMTAANVSATCTPSQTTYILVFDIVGGQGPFTFVSGNSGVISGSTFTSNPITAGIPYSVTISDGSSCGNLVVSGVSPTCVCLVSASFATTDQTICIGSSVNLVTTLSGGAPGSYTVGYNAGATPLSTSGMSSGGILATVSPTTTTTYTLTDVTDGNCIGSASGSVTITVEQLPDAGGDHTATYCGDGSQLNLMDLVNDNSEPTGGSFASPSITLLPVNSGIYPYTMAGNICPDDVANYTVNIDPALTTSGVQANCTPSQTSYVVSFSISGGSGSGYTVDGVPTGSTFTSAPISLPNPGGYSFLVDDGGPCGPITVSGVAPNCFCPVTAAFASSNQTICIGSSASLELDLNGGAPGSYNVVYTGGGGGNPTGLSDGALITVSPTTTTTYTLTSVSDGNCAGSASGSVTITVEQLPDAGSNVTGDYCGNGSNLNLLTILSGDAGTPGTFSTNPVVLNPANSGIYTYTVQGNQCPDDVANYTINIDPQLTTSGVQANCSAAQTDYTVTFTISGGSGSGYTVDGVPTGSTFTSAPISLPNPGGYSFSVDDGGPCGPITVSGSAPNCSCPVTASFASGNQTICIGSSANLELDLSGGAPGSYDLVYTGGAGGNPTGLSDGALITVSPTTTTTYTLVSVTDGNCIGSVNGSVTVTVEQLPDAGSNVTGDYCGNGSNLNLLTILSGDAGTPGTFSTNPVVLNPANSGIYTYTVQGNQCPDDVANYTINIDPQLTTTGLQATCSAAQTDYTVTFTISGGSGSGYTVDGVPTGSTFTSAPISLPNPGGYSFSVDDGGPCGPITVSGSAPNCSCPVTASFASGNQTICIGSSANLELDLNGGTDGNYIVMYSAGGVPMGSINGGGLSDGAILTVSPTVTTTYTLTSAEDGNCIGSASGSVTVTVEQLPNAGGDHTAAYCGDGTQLNLMNVVNDNSEPTNGSFATTSIALIPSNSGVYPYTVTGNQCPNDVANYTINIQEELIATNVSAACESNQVDYTVEFTISGGTPPYTVTNVTSGAQIPVIGNSFSETLVFANNPNYNYTISDNNGPCPDVTVSGIAPDCNCIAQGSISSSTTICLGDCANITFNLIGDGPFNVSYQNGNSEQIMDLVGIDNGHIVSVCPTVSNTYTLVSVSDTYCDGVITGQPVTVTVNNPFSISGITQICDNTAEYYQVQFNINGGTPPYYFSGATNTSSNPNVFLSGPIASGTGYSISVTDAGVCPAQVVSSPIHTCACISDAGSIPTTPLEVCQGGALSISTNGTETLDANDMIQYILHGGSANSIENIIGTSPDGNFTFNYASMVPGAVYYINAVVGNALGGNVDLNDDCTSVSNGTSVIMNALPTAFISGGATVCPGETVDLTIVFTGEGPWDFSYSVDGIPQSSPNFSSTNEFTLTSTQPGSYTITAVSDNNCVGTYAGTATIQNYVTPTATLSGNPEVCEGSGDGPEVVFTGDGPWTFVYSIGGVNQPPITTNFPTYIIPAETNGNYALVSLEGSNCTGTVSGSQNITILAAPTATITGGGTVCAGDSATFNVALTGAAPWTVNYTVDGVPQTALTNSSSNYTFQSSIDGDYVIVSVSDNNCQGEVLASQASLNVNPLPTADITTSTNSVCIGEEVDLGIDLEGVPPYSVTYVLDGDTTVVTGLYSDFFTTLEPEQPLTFEVLMISDGSNPTCTSTPNGYMYIDAHALPNAPVLSNDTICAENGQVSIGVNSAPGLTYSWSPENNLSDPTVSNPLLTPKTNGTVATTYQYILTATNGICSASDTMKVTVDPGPMARFTFSPNPVKNVDPTVFFNNNSIAGNGTAYFWIFDSLGTSTEFEPTFEFPNAVNRNYTVELTAIDLSTGCMDMYSDVVSIQPEMLMYVPTAFTPDGDGLNDLWGPVLSNVDPDNYKLTVHDRFGQVVFTTTNIHKKWNGDMNGDSYFVEAGVYVWMIETKNEISLEEVKMQGMVTVVR